MEVIVANLKRRFSGVTSTVLALLPVQSRRIRIAALGPNLPRHWQRITWRDCSATGGSCRQAGGFASGMRGATSRCSPGCPALGVAHAVEARLHVGGAEAAQRMEPLSSRAMDAVIAASPEAESYLEVPSTVVLHGVDIARYRPAEDRNAQWAATGLPGKFGIGVFGRVRAQKGTDRFVHAMCRLLPRYPDFTASSWAGSRWIREGLPTPCARKSPRRASPIASFSWTSCRRTRCRMAAPRHHRGRPAGVGGVRARAAGSHGERDGRGGNPGRRGPAPHCRRRKPVTWWMQMTWRVSKPGSIR